MNEKEIAERAYIRGHLTYICRSDSFIDINEIVERIYKLKTYFEDTDGLQKAILGEIAGNQKEDVSLGQLTKVSILISEKIFKEGYND